MTPQSVAGLLILAGCALFVVACAVVWPPAGMVAAAALLIAFGHAVLRGSRS